MNLGLAESFAKIHHGNDFPAQVDYALNQIGRAGNRSNLRNTDNLADGGDTDAVRFIADAEADDLKIFFHREVSGPLGTRHFGVFKFMLAARLRASTLAEGVAATQALLVGAVNNEAVHTVEQVAGKLEHLFGGSGKLG